MHLMFFFFFFLLVLTFTNSVRFWEAITKLLPKFFNQFQELHLFLSYIFILFIAILGGGVEIEYPPHKKFCYYDFLWSIAFKFVSFFYLSFSLSLFLPSKNSILNICYI